MFIIILRFKKTHTGPVEKKTEAPYKIKAPLPPPGKPALPCNSQHCPAQE